MITEHQKHLLTEYLSRIKNNQKRYKPRTQTRKRVLQKADHHCMQCGCLDNSLQVVPLVHPFQGAPVARDNWIALCASCVAFKGKGELSFIGSGVALTSRQEKLLKQRETILLTSKNHLTRYKTRPALIKNLQSRFKFQRVVMYVIKDKNNYFFCFSCSGSGHSRALLSGLFRFQYHGEMVKINNFACWKVECKDDQILNKLCFTLIEHNTLLYSVDLPFVSSWELTGSSVRSLVSLSRAYDYPLNRTYSATPQAVYARKQHKIYKHEKLKQKKARLDALLLKTENQIINGSRFYNPDEIEKLKLQQVVYQLQLMEQS